MRSCVMLTGATGAIGAALLAELLGQGFTVYCLVRPLDGRSPEHRLACVVQHPRAVAVAGDVTRPLCGLDPTKLPRIDKFVHAAADTSLTQGKRSSVMTANALGTANALQLARALGLPEFHHIGTAYIAGDAPVLGESGRHERLATGAPRNPYEASKLEAERAARAYEGEVSVYRPSIVVGRTDDGSTANLDGWYAFFKSAWRLRESIRKGSYVDEHGDRIWKYYKLTIPIGVKGMHQVSMNLIQIDWLAQTLASLVALPARGRTYNLTHPGPVLFKDVLRMTFDALDIANVTLVERLPGQFLSPFKIALSRMVNRELDGYRPYIVHAPRFVSRNLYEDLGPSWAEPPAITENFIHLTMRYAEAEWQREQDEADLRAQKMPIRL